MEKLSFTHSTLFWKESGHELFFKVEGEITEKFFQPAVQFSPPEKVFLNLKDITSFNSTGVRQWLVFFGLFADHTVEVAECSVDVIDNLNLVNSLLGSARILSFYAPYFDPETEEEKTVFIESAKFAEDLKALRPPRFPSDRPEASYEFDAIPEQYFKEIAQHLP